MSNFQSIPVRLFDVLFGYGHGQFEFSHHFETNALFWSLQRLFGSYERIIRALNVPFDEAYFLDADIESFLIRLRIVSNDIAFIVWQALPAGTQGLKQPRGGTHPRNREMSVLEIANFLTKQRDVFPELEAAFRTFLPRIEGWKDARENVIHYKSKAMVIDETPRAFALVNAANSQAVVPTTGGGLRLVTRPVGSFADEQLSALYCFLNEQLPDAMLHHGSRLGWRMGDFGRSSGARFSSVGVQTFRLRLNIQS